MRTKRVGAGIGLVLGALALSVPAAVAADDAGIDISPGNASPGSTVTVTTTACGEGETYGKGTSEVGGAFHLFKGDGEGELTGRFRVPEGTRPGSDTVTVKCPPRVKVTDDYEITRHPSGAVEAGFGAADGRGTQLALGSALLAAAAVGYVVRMRRRPSGDRI
ncbi:sortase [Streptomyces sp. NPDC002889]|uniref:sortase n=1 Tax=Streptomyces sp. NPDC002889 TaxID=3364669 RepID=UPI0036A49E12